MLAKTNMTRSPRCLLMWGTRGEGSGRGFFLGAVDAATFFGGGSCSLAGNVGLADGSDLVFSSALLASFLIGFDGAD